jgi:hypothetical protein
MGDCSNGHQSAKYWSKNHVMVVREDGILCLQSGLEIHVPALHTDLAVTDLTFKVPNKSRHPNDMDLQFGNYWVQYYKEM